MHHIDHMLVGQIERAKNFLISPHTLPHSCISTNYIHLSVIFAEIILHLNFSLILQTPLHSVEILKPVLMVAILEVASDEVLCRLRIWLDLLLAIETVLAR